MALDLSNLQAFPQLGFSMQKHLQVQEDEEGDEKPFQKVQTDHTQVPEGDDGLCALDGADDSDDDDEAYLSVSRQPSKSLSMTTASSPGRIPIGKLFLKEDADDRSPWASPVANAFCSGFGLDEDDETNEEPFEMGLPQKVALPEKVELSIGSEGHGSGTCKPCAWFWKAQGCQNGRDCLHCHLCPKSEVKARKKAKARERKEQEAQEKQEEKGPQASMEVFLTAFKPPPGLAPPPGLLPMELLESPEPEDEEVLDRLPGTSTGSVLHSSGNCKPCAWYWKSQGCANGEDCLHCHLCPQGEVKRRKKQKKASPVPAEEQQVSVQPRAGNEVFTQIQQQQLLIQQQQQQLLQMQLQLQVQEEKMQLLAGNQAMLAAAKVQMQMAVEVPFPAAFGLDYA